MPKGFFHVNVFDDGAVCLSILKEDIPSHLLAVNAKVPAWSPSCTVKQILLAVQELISEPNFGSVASPAAYEVNRRSTAEYRRRMREQAQKYAPKADDD